MVQPGPLIAARGPWIRNLERAAVDQPWPFVWPLPVPPKLHRLRSCGFFSRMPVAGLTFLGFEKKKPLRTCHFGSAQTARCWTGDPHLAVSRDLDTSFSIEHCPVGAHFRLGIRWMSRLLAKISVDLASLPLCLGEYGMPADTGRCLPPISFVSCPSQETGPSIHSTEHKESSSDDVTSVHISFYSVILFPFVSSNIFPFFPQMVGS